MWNYHRNFMAVKTGNKKIPNSNVYIRDMELEDLPAVFSLGERLFTAEKWPNLHRTWDEYEIVGLFASDGDFCLVAEVDDKFAGFILGTFIAKRHSAWSYGWILWLGVEPEIKRQGIGKKLTERLREKFIDEGARMMLVDTEKNNKAAIQFFKQQGFGNEIQHVFMSNNLTTHPDYLERKAKRKNSPAGKKK